MKTIPLFVLVLLLSGCVGRGGITSGDVKVRGQKDAGTPATLATSNEGEVIELHPGDTVKIVREEATPGKPASDEQRAVEAKPATETISLTLGSATNWRRNKATMKADTGTVDTTVATKRIEAEERRPLLYCAIVATVAGLGFMYVRFQSIAVMCFIGSGCFFLAWRMAEISPWVGGLFLVAAVVGFAFYKRAEWDKNGDGIPDALQRGKDSS